MKVRNAPIIGSHLVGWALTRKDRFWELLIGGKEWIDNLLFCWLRF